jgi:acyl phosphate:glycerol-3-phosphate acyltransferase
LTVMSGVLVVLIWWSHRANIKRIIAGNENLVSFGLYYHIKQKQDKDKKE